MVADAAKQKSKINLVAKVAKVTDPFKVSLIKTMSDIDVALEERINTLKSFMVQSTLKLNKKIAFKMVGWTDSPRSTAKAAQQADKEEVRPDWG
jgi:hypothetical protein